MTLKGTMSIIFYGDLFFIFFGNKSLFLPKVVIVILGAGKLWGHLYLFFSEQKNPKNSHELSRVEDSGIDNWDSQFDSLSMENWTFDDLLDTQTVGKIYSGWFILTRDGNNKLPETSIVKLCFPLINKINYYTFAFSFKHYQKNIFIWITVFKQQTATQLLPSSAKFGKILPLSQWTNGAGFPSFFNTNHSLPLFYTWNCILTWQPVFSSTAINLSSEASNC